MYVGPLLEEIPKPVLIRALEEEAPQFMTTLMSMTLPTSETRLRLPILDTAGKAQAAECNRNPLEEFISDSCHEVSGCKMSFKAFFEAFQASLSAFESAQWTKRKTRQNIPDAFPVGKSTGGQLYVGNISLEAVEIDPATPRYLAKGAYLKLEEK
jgi:hypothetical protein